MAKKYKFLLLAAAVTILCLCGATQAYAGTSGQVAIAFDRLTIGQGYLVEPILVDLQEGDTAATVLDRVLKEKGYGYDKSGTIARNFYLQGIENADTGVVNIPMCIQQMEAFPEKDMNPPNNQAINKWAPWLGEFSYNNMSGWMYCVDNIYPSLGLSEYPLKDGEVIEVRFTVYGYGADLGNFSKSSGLTPLEIADRSRLVWSMAVMNADLDAWFENESYRASYQAAKAVLDDFECSQQDVDAAVQSLPSPEEKPIVPVREIRLGETSIELTEGDKKKIAAEVLPGYAANRKVTYQSNRPEVASVDPQTGEVTAKKAGSAVIAVTAQDGSNVRAECTVTVRALSITLDQTKVTLYTKGKKTATLQAAVNGKKVSAGQVVWKSSKTGVVSVKAGKITAKKAGKSDITATINGKTAKCTVTVKKPSLKLAKTSRKVKKGKTIKILAKATPSGKIKYRSKNKKIATVNAKGVVKGKKKGKATIIVTCNGVKKKCSVRVV